MPSSEELILSRLNTELGRIQPIGALPSFQVRVNPVSVQRGGSPEQDRAEKMLLGAPTRTAPLRTAAAVKESTNGGMILLVALGGLFLLGAIR